LGAVEVSRTLGSRSGEPAPAAGAWKILVSLVLTVPVLVVFGSLLAEADPLLERFVDGVFSWQPPELLGHAVLIVVSGWLALGWLGLMVHPPRRTEGVRYRPPILLGSLEVAIPLGVLAFLLAAFVGLQGRYLFGGEEVLRSTGLSYAEFARRGFFELVAVAGFGVPLLCLAQWVLDRGAAGAVESFRALVAVLGLLIGLVMVSALGRMHLYVAAYGLTEARVYAASFMCWIAVVLGWFAFTELRGHQERFVTGAVVAGFAVLAVLNFVNPDGLVAGVNLARAGSGRSLDAEYLSQLSPDAVPAVVAAWADLEKGVRCELQASLLARVQPVSDWRQWNLGMARAARVVRTVAPEAGCGQPTSG
jgi:hypothetical protein